MLTIAFPVLVTTFCAWLTLAGLASTSFCVWFLAIDMYVCMSMATNLPPRLPLHHGWLSWGPGVGECWGWGPSGCHHSCSCPSMPPSTSPPVPLPPRTLLPGGVAWTLSPGSPPLTTLTSTYSMQPTTSPLTPLPPGLFHLVGLPGLFHLALLCWQQWPLLTQCILPLLLLSSYPPGLFHLVGLPGLFHLALLHSGPLGLFHPAGLPRLFHLAFIFLYCLLLFHYPPGLFQLAILHWNPSGLFHLAGLLGLFQPALCHPVRRCPTDSSAPDSLPVGDQLVQSSALLVLVAVSCLCLEVVYLHLVVLISFLLALTSFQACWTSSLLLDAVTYCIVSLSTALALSSLDNTLVSLSPFNSWINIHPSSTPLLLPSQEAPSPSCSAWILPGPFIVCCPPWDHTSCPTLSWMPPLWSSESQRPSWSVSCTSCWGLPRSPWLPPLPRVMGFLVLRGGVILPPLDLGTPGLARAVPTQQVRVVEMLAVVAETDPWVLLGWLLLVVLLLTLVCAEELAPFFLVGTLAPVNYFLAFPSFYNLMSNNQLFLVVQSTLLWAQPVCLAGVGAVFPPGPGSGSGSGSGGTGGLAGSNTLSSFHGCSHGRVLVGHLLCPPSLGSTRVEG